MRLFAAASIALALPLAASAQPPAATAASTPQAAALRKLFSDSDEAMLRRNPIQALFRGDLRYADQFGDYVTDGYYAAEKAAAESDLAALNRIDRKLLSPEDQLSYDVFRYQTETTLKGFAPALLKAQVERPIDHMSGFQTLVPDVSSGDGAAPFKTVKDYDDNLKRLAGYIVYLQRAQGRMEQGMADGIVNPKLVMRNVVAQLDALVAQGLEGSTFYKPVTKFPDAVPAADRTRLTAAYAAFIRDRLNPAHVALRDFIRDKYLPKARDSVGLGEMPGGPALYTYLVAQTTTTDMTPDAIHALGLSEVARIHTAMEAIKTRVGFKGTLSQFFEHMRTNPRFAPATREAIRDAFLAIDTRVKATVGRDFSTIPKSPLDIRPVPAFKEKGEAAGSYMQGTPDGTRPGVFYYNAYDLPSRFTWGFETLFLHEAMPGHHFQISLAQENSALPSFQRFGGNTAFVEGWALYAESLGPELGMFTDPYQLYGHLNDEILRAMRLVVDTGLHSKGWSRDKAIAYMLDNSAMGRTDATAEVERYIAIASQATAYKIGQLTIRRLRTRAEQALGPKFDVRAFHAQVLMSGALPMAVLESKIDRWIASQK
ncbi:DUF885 domain-containing protein [Sphingomonas prati]|uniref:Uncharacterized protein (DUF885 family) n=1 Tax=Sphingomonas prati TaxID=1843237 RepID=A0A7W9BS62_9SPHN|nr:DUF885 domain-containing protein [Sphingomonas prati]MBB5728996.1 uncharacterized protein (DUF885 family) [Sphingomonas prati]GGE85871.1 hypothetical protein GCM10011404_18360 [Sphingomonas prati]